ncbi:hypothetical protein BLA29_004495 [Euroglyphus maynei]|uniref:Uncharacterized protein n=1 Tax=Euroglyphus maynei TaxID=6958 RepID=A0A1Y3BF10_EURMA|nr:hypothetical protein BLA29_004495 [Euroglyphus maynei]
MFGQPQSQQQDQLSANQQFQQNLAKIRLAPGLMLSSDDPTSSGQRQVQTQDGGITITRGKPILLPPDANRILVATPSEDNLRFRTNSLQAQASHHNNRHSHHHQNRLQTFQPQASMMTEKSDAREFSEWWKERAASANTAPLTMLTGLPA